MWINFTFLAEFWLFGVFWFGRLGLFLVDVVWYPGYFMSSSHTRESLSDKATCSIG